MGDTLPEQTFRNIIAKRSFKPIPLYTATRKMRNLGPTIICSLYNLLMELTIIDGSGNDGKTVRGTQS